MEHYLLFLHGRHLKSASNVLSCGDRAVIVVDRFMALPVPELVTLHILPGNDVSLVQHYYHPLRNSRRWCESEAAGHGDGRRPGKYSVPPSSAHRDTIALAKEAIAAMITLYTGKGAEA
jgi:hypothetical protein